MATVTKPIALDESINTTEQTPRNIADVLAEELARIAENILPPNAEGIAYDNTESGLDATNVQDAIDEVISSQADVIADTMADLTENKTAVVTDGVADFETIDGSLVKSLVVEIEPNLSGYTQEDVTVVGKNKCPNATSGTYGNVVTTVNNDGSVSFSGSCNANASCDFFRSYTALPYGVEPNETYTISLGAVFNRFEIYYSNDGTTFVGTPLVQMTSASHETFLLPSDATGMLIRAYLRSGSSYSLTIYPQLEKGNQPTTFEPYHGKTYTTPFNQTVYGGTLDVLTGELTITHGYLDASSVTWTAQTNSRWFYNGLTAVIKIPPNNATPTDTISDRFSAMSNDNMASTTNIGLSVNGSGSLVIRNGSTTVQPEGQIVYPLATPTTLSLTPQTVKALVGENHISASTGEVTECKFSMLINGDDLAQIIGG